MVLQFILNWLLKVFFGSDTSQWMAMLMSILATAGMWGIFQKSGVPGWWSLIPCAGEAKLGKISDRENEGRAAAVLRGINILVMTVGSVIELYMLLTVPENITDLFTAMTFLGVVEVVVELIRWIYTIRIYLGLIEVYNRKKKWIVLWVVLEFIPACLWGWSKKYQPEWTLQELESEAANRFSNARAQTLDCGLTVNLEERTATEFFKKKYLLRDIHMYIQPGHMVLLLGGSGAGKTTYLNAVNGYEKAKAEVVLNGRNMYSNYKEMQYDIGFVPQLDLMRGSDSVYRTLMDAANLRLPVNYTKAERQARVEEVMGIFGLTPVKDNLVVKLSGGQRKRLSIAMEFISNPSLFILDEPDSGLDGVMARELFTQLRKIADEGKIIIVITHTPDRVIDLFDDVIVLAKDANRTGRLAYFGPIEEAREFFGKEKMEEIVKSINRTEEGGEGRADEFILKFAEVQHG